MRLVVCLALAAAIGGCATYSERLAQDAWLSFETPRSQREFESCLVPKLRDKFSGWVATPAGDSTVWSLSPGNDNVTIAAITLTPVPTGTRVEARSVHTRGGYRRMGEMIQSCE